jgi:hypothetical protein
MKAVKILTALLFISFGSFATHLKGGQISYKLVDANTRTVEITLELFASTDPGSVDQPGASINFGDGSPCGHTKLLKRETVVKEVDVLTFKFLHSYPSDGSYLISFFEENRNTTIANITDPIIYLSNFSISSLVKIDAFNKNLSSFKFLNNYTSVAEVGKEFSITTIGYDFEGDSLSFSFLRPLTANGVVDCSANFPYEINGYFIPDSAYINPYSGNMKWTPSREGQYVFVVKVSEFKNGSLIGYSTKEFIVESKKGNTELQLQRGDNNQLKPFEVIDIESGTNITLRARFASDPVNELELLAFSELLDKNKGSFVTYDSAEFKIANYSITIDPSLKRPQPYIFTFRGVSKGNPELKKDLTYILNTQDGVQFNYVYQPGPEDPILGLEDVPGKRVLSAFPNPATQTFYLNTSAFVSPIILFYDSKGLLAGKQRLESASKAEVKRNNMLPGLYLFILQSNGIGKGWGKVVFE